MVNYEFKSGLRSGLFAIMALLLSVVMPSCSKDSGDVEAWPVKKNGDTAWSLIDANGNFVASNCFEKMPLPMTCGRVWTRNDGGHYKLCEIADGTYRKVTNKEFRFVSPFYGGKAIVAACNEGITMIDADGETVMSLDSISGEKVDHIASTADGLAVFVTAGERFGVMDYKGNVIVNAEYSSIPKPGNGRIVARNNTAVEANDSEQDGEDKRTVTRVFDYSGKEAFSFDSEQYSWTDDRYSDGCLLVSLDIGEQTAWGIIDKDGKEVVKPSTDNNAIFEFRNGNYLYYDNNLKIGLKSLTGKVLIEPRFTGAYFVTDNVLAVTETDVTSDETLEYKLVGLNGEPVNDDEIYTADTGMDNLMFANLQSEGWVALDFTGKRLENVPTMESVFLDFAGLSNDIIRSDYVDLEVMLSNLRFKTAGYGSLTFNSSVPDVLAAAYGKNSIPSAANVSFTDEVSIFPDSDGEVYSVTVKFPEKLSKRSYEQERVTDFVWGGYRTYKTNEVSTGFVYSQAKPQIFVIQFNNYGKLNGKLKALYDKLLERIGAEGGVVVEQNDAATLFDLLGDKKALVALEARSVSISLGKLPASLCVVHPYAGNKEIMDNEDDEFSDI